MARLRAGLLEDFMAKPKNRALADDQVQTPERERAGTGPMVPVRARTAISEQIGGVQTFIPAGGEAELPESRVTALGPLVERIAAGKSTEPTQENPAAG